MEYRIFRFSFNGGVHIGDGSLEDHGINLRADTLFSALCIEALKSGGEDMLNKLVEFARAGKLLISDAFPFMGGEYYLPKPVFSVKVENTDDDDNSNVKKIFKNLKYIPLDMVDDFLTGEFDKETVYYISDRLNNPEKPLGFGDIAARAAIRPADGGDDPLPYYVGVYKFGKNAGLYVIAAGGGGALEMFRELLGNVAYCGIGGKRSSGLGRFSVEEAGVPEDILERFSNEYSAYMTLSVSLPNEGEMEKSLENATYALLRRSGFVFSETYSDEPLRKNDLYVLGSGSVVRYMYDGNVYDVSNKGAHPVYRYAKPLFYGVNV